MAAAGVAWGVYTLRAKGAGDPLAGHRGQLPARLRVRRRRSVWRALPWASLDAAGAGYAVASGALASGVGYAIWYTALRGLRVTSAATVQLSVPVLAALGGVALLGEPITVRLVVASAAILGGIALVIAGKAAAR